MAKTSDYEQNAYDLWEEVGLIDQITASQAIETEKKETDAVPGGM